MLLQMKAIETEFLEAVLVISKSSKSFPSTNSNSCLTTSLDSITRLSPTKFFRHIRPKISSQVCNELRNLQTSCVAKKWEKIVYFMNA